MIVDFVKRRIHREIVADPVAHGLALNLYLAGEERFRMEPEDDADARRQKLAHFLAHAHFLEKRVARSLEYHLDARAHATSPYPAKAVALVLADEGDHVRYTRETVMDLLPSTEARKVLEHHAEAEARANISFSARQLKQMLARRGEIFPRASRVAYRAIALVMEAMAHEPAFHHRG